jgi:hypothetical protein
LATYSTSWEEETIDTPEEMTFQDEKTILWGGIPTKVFLVRMKVQGASFDTEVLANGTLVRGKIGGLLEVRAESLAAAKKLDTGQIDMLAASCVPVDKHLGHPKRVRTLVLEVADAGDFVFPTSHRQQVRQENGKTVLQLRKDFPVTEAVPLSPQDRQQFVRSTPTLQSDQGAIRNLAKKILNGEKDPVKAAGLLQRWVYRKLRKTMAANSTTALEVLDNLAGDCTEHTLLFVALARAAGIPAREVGGLMFADIGKPTFGWHAWAEIHDGKQWVTVDPTWNEVFVDATHIKLSEGSEDLLWVNVAGKLKLHVVSFEKE